MKQKHIKRSRGKKSLLKERAIATKAALANSNFGLGSP